MFRVILLDDAIQMNVDEILAGRRSPVAQEPGLDVLELQGFVQQRVVEQIDLADRQVIGGPPVGVHLAEELWIKRRVHGRYFSTFRVGHVDGRRRVSPAGFGPSI